MMRCRRQTIFNLAAAGRGRNRLYSPNYPNLDRPMRETSSRVTGMVGFLFLIFFLNMLSRLGLAPLLPAIAQELELSHAAAGSLFLFVSVGYGSGLFVST
jgi:hypothetical protein